MAGPRGDLTLVALAPHPSGVNPPTPSAVTPGGRFESRLPSIPWAGSLAVIAAMFALVVGSLSAPAHAGPPKLPPPPTSSAPGGWQGTIVTTWTSSWDTCDGCDSDLASSKGSLTYTLPAGPESTYREVTASGAGSMTYAFDFGDSQCESTGTWSGQSFPATVRIDSQKQALLPTWVRATFQPWSDPLCQDNSDWTVGGFPSSGSGADPEHDETSLRAVPDTDPDPTRWVGTATFAGTPNYTYLKSYSYTITVNLTKGGEDACLPRSGIQTVRCVATGVTLRPTAKGVRVTATPTSATVLVNWNKIGAKGKANFRRCAGSCFIPMSAGDWWINGQIRDTPTLLASRSGLRPHRIK